MARHRRYSLPPKKHGLYMQYLPVNNAYVLMWHGQIVKGPDSYEEIRHQYDYAVNARDLPVEVRRAHGQRRRARRSRGDYSLSSLTLSRRSAPPGWKIDVERGPHGQFRGVGRKVGTRVTLQGPWRASATSAESACAEAIHVAHHKYGLARRHARNDYPGFTTAGTYELRRDGKHVMTGSEAEVFSYLHRHHSFSVSHALKYEGYSVHKVGSGSRRRGRRSPKRNARTGRFTRAR